MRNLSRGYRSGQGEMCREWMQAYFPSSLYDVVRSVRSIHQVFHLPHSSHLQNKNYKTNKKSNTGTQRRSAVRLRRKKARQRNRRRFEVSRCWTSRVLRAINHFKSQWTYEVWRETRTRKLRRVLCAWIDLVMSCYFLVVTHIFVNNA